MNITKCFKYVLFSDPVLINDLQVTNQPPPPPSKLAKLGFCSKKFPMFWNVKNNNFRKCVQNQFRNFCDF